ncbi:MAG: acyl-CoA thioesterase [Moorea sp. SIO2I5]|nr:acyl-CoA thioesterase [Moorena sp. SIO2I5]
MVEAFMDQNGPGDEPIEARTKFPKPPPLPANPGNIECAVEWRDLDPNGHLNNAAYFSYIENGTLQLCSNFGWPIDRMEKEGFAIFARRYRIEYLKPVGIGDRLILQTWVADPRRAMATRHYRLLRKSDMQPVVQARCLWVWVDIENEKPMRIPPHFLEDFATNITQS